MRTEWNVRDSDATLVFSLSPCLTGGSKLTMDYARKLGKPCLHVYPGQDRELIQRFFSEHGINTLNIAGPRRSGEPRIAEFVAQQLDELLNPGNA
ncbi:MAG: YpsA SLOG family protein [Burkholderiales bacterium]